HTDEGRRVYGLDGRRLAAGDRVVLGDLGGTLEAIAEGGAAELYRGSLARRIAAHVAEEGGQLDRHDLASYRVIRRRPVRARYRRRELVSNPPPSAGGLLIAYGLQLLDALGPPARAGSAEALAALAQAMRAQGRVRGDSFARNLRRGGL